MTDSGPTRHPDASPVSTAAGGGPEDVRRAPRPVPHRSRRDVLAVAGVGAVGAGLLAACGGSDTASSSASSAPAATSAAAPSSAPPTSAAPTTATSAAPTAPATAASNGFSVPTSAIPVGGGTIYPDEKLVVTQPTAGSFRAFSAVCPHQGCIVAAVEGGQIQCPCHASAFDDATGARLSGPAPTGLTTEQVTVTGSTVTVAT